MLETEEQLVPRFIGGLQSQLQNDLQQFNPTTLSEAHQRSLAMEIQFRSPWSAAGSRSRFQPPTANDSNPVTTTIPIRRQHVVLLQNQFMQVTLLQRHDHHVPTHSSVLLVGKPVTDKPLVQIRIVEA